MGTGTTSESVSVTPEQALQLAQNPSVSADALRSLFAVCQPLDRKTVFLRVPPQEQERFLTWKATYQNIIRAIAQNPNIPIDVLPQINSEYVDALLLNPAWGLWLIEGIDFLEVFSPTMLEAIIRNSTDPVVIRHIASLTLQQQSSKKQNLLQYHQHHRLNDIALALVYNQNTPSDVISKLCDSDIYGIQPKIATHPNADNKTLAILAGSIDEKARTFAKQVLQERLDDEQKQTQTALDSPQRIAETSLPEIHIYFALRHAERVRMAAEQKNKITEIPIETWAEIASGSAYGASLAAEQNHLPRHLYDVLAQHVHVHVRAVLAENLACPSDLLEKLATDPTEFVRINVALNPHTPAKTIASMHTDQSVWVRACVAKHHTTPPHVGVLLWDAVDPDTQGMVLHRRETIEKKRRT